MPNTSARKAVFLDRDGVLIRSDIRDGRPYAITSASDMEILPGVHDAAAQLKAAGFFLVVVTNQPDVVDGSLSRETVETVNAALANELGIDDFRVCYEKESPQSRCYKPKPGMILDAAHDHNLDVTKSYMVGDRWRDIGAGKNAGCYSIFIDCGYSEQPPEAPDATASSLLEAARIILAHATNG
ncbi:HAD-IIIA family hydrolase [Magnetovibrio sp.]|uniref:D-glycero-alpha-D-manno-heptose-1,7-bisphosphate 7-phosphatase n=1 Tax=Magnetovibrio sp. TaxID=2024836 RepID=UPI002F948E70